VECYVPLGHRLKCPRRKRGRRVEVAFVVLPNYAFVRIDAEVPAWGVLDPDRCPEFLRVIMAPAARGADPVPAVVPDPEIESIRRAEAARLYDIARGLGLAAVFRLGTPVRVRSGYFLRDMTGTIRQVCGTRRVKVEIEGRLFDLDVDTLDPIAL
jgi:transcription antitermination factor NusG